MIDKGLIPVAIARAKLVNPDPSVVPDWEDAIFKDLQNPSLKFSWNNFISSLLP